MIAFRGTCVRFSKRANRLQFALKNCRCNPPRFVLANDRYYFPSSLTIDEPLLLPQCRLSASSRSTHKQQHFKSLLYKALIIGTVSICAYIGFVASHDECIDVGSLKQKRKRDKASVEHIRPSPSAWWEDIIVSEEERLVHWFENALGQLFCPKIVLQLFSVECSYLNSFVLVLMYFISKDGHAARRLISNNGDDVIKKLLFSSAVSNERFACLIANLFHHAPSSPLLECFDVFTNLWVPCLQSWLRSDSFKMNLSALSIVYSSLFTFPVHMVLQFSTFQPKFLMRTFAQQRGCSTAEKDLLCSRLIDILCTYSHDDKGATLLIHDDVLSWMDHNIPMDTLPQRRDVALLLAVLSSHAEIQQQLCSSLMWLNRFIQWLSVKDKLLRMSTATILVNLLEKDELGMQVIQHLGTEVYYSLADIVDMDVQHTVEQLFSRSLHQSISTMPSDSFYVDVTADAFWKRNQCNNES